MTVEFQSAAQQSTYTVVRTWLEGLFPDDVEADADRPLLYTHIGRVVVQTRIYPWNSPAEREDAIIQNRAMVVHGIKASLSLFELALELLSENYERRFGAFGIDPHGSIFVGHSIAGASCGRVELQASICSIAEVADYYHDELVRRSGGESALS